MGLIQDPAASNGSCDPPVDVPFVQARYYTKVPAQTPRSIRYVVLHDMEAAEKPGTAIAVANWFASPASPVASAHCCVDPTEIIQCVPYSDVAYGAPGVNHNGLHLEHAGWANQSRDAWLSAISMKELDLSAILVAFWCGEYALPIAFVDAEALLAGQSKGITTHAEVTKACQLAQARKLTGSDFYNHHGSGPMTTHTDPGAAFPIEEYLALVTAQSGAAAGLDSSGRPSTYAEPFRHWSK